MNKTTDSSEDLDVETVRVCAIIESVAKGFAPDSDEGRALRDAALAYTVVHQHKVLMKSYRKLLSAFDGKLTDEMKADLRRHGIEPDDLDGED